jgi:AcrR family transcriptional regulator
MSSERSYHSSLREEQALQTRLRIRRAARELFASQGFTSTTIGEIAESAGVSAATVYATYDSKPGIVVAMLEDLEEEAELGPKIEAVFAEPHPHRQLRAYVAAHCDLFTKGSDILRAAMRAIEDPGVAALAEAGDAHRRQVIDALTAGWQKAGALPPGLTQRQAADRLWLLTTVEGFLNATDRLGWSPRKYEKWLGDLAEREVLERAR